MQADKILKLVRLSEKSNKLSSELGQYTFEVFGHANKHQIAEAVEQTFKVTVRRVNTMTYRGKNNRPVAGILVDDYVYPAETLLAKTHTVDGSSVLGLLGSWEEVRPALQAAVDACQPEQGVPLDSVQLEAPILYPNAVFATGANYFDHLEEMADVSFRLTGKRTVIQRVAEPYIIMKMSAHSIIGRLVWRQWR